MSHDQSCGCPEFLQLSRRSFVGVAGGTLAAAALAPAWMPRVSFAKTFNTPPQDVIVAIFLRGGADGLNMCMPYNDAGYVSARPTLKVYAPDDTTVPVPSRALQLGNATYGNVGLGLHPAMAALLPAYQEGKLLIAHCCGLTGANQSHFDAQKYMEAGKWNDPQLFTGWLGRHLATADPINPSSTLRGLGVADGLQRSLLGAPESLPVPDIQSNPGTVPALNNLNLNYGLLPSNSTETARRQALHRIASDPGTVAAGMYESAPDILRLAAQNTVNTISRLNAIGAAGYTPQPTTGPLAPQAVYPANSIGYALRTSAAIIAANNMLTGGEAVDAIAIDVGSWDTHSNEAVRDPDTGVFTGLMIPPMTNLDNALGAFYRDVIASRGLNVTVVVMSEFGRRVGENSTPGATPGTDHGYGNVMWVMGSQVLGGRVIAKASAGAAGFGWPGVPVPTGNQIAASLTMPITLDYRHLLAEIIDRRLGNAASLSQIFPGFTPSYQGIVS